MKPFVSIIIPVYNCKDYLKRCLDSVFAQNYDNFEVICIDDGSNDGSKELIKNYDVRYYYQENSGQATARNRGIELAKGDWICFVDGDDAISPNYLSCLTKGIIDDVGMVVCRIRRIDEKGKTNIDVLDKIGVVDSKEALINVNIGPTNKLIKKSIIKDCRFIEGKLRFEDILFTPELIVNAKKINIIEDVLYDYYVRDNSTMRRFDESLNDIFKVLDLLLNKDFYKDYKDELDYIVYKNGLFGHFSRIVYFNWKTIFAEIKKARNYIEKNVPNYYQNKYIKADKQPYFYVGTRLFRIKMLWTLVLPLKILERSINR